MKMCDSKNFKADGLDEKSIDIYHSHEEDPDSSFLKPFGVIHGCLKIVAGQIIFKYIHEKCV